MTPTCLVVLTIGSYLLLGVGAVFVEIKKLTANKIISFISIVIGPLSLVGSLYFFFRYHNTDYLADLFALFLIYVFFTNLFKQENNYEKFGMILLKNMFLIIIELCTLVVLTYTCEKKIDFIGNVILGELVFPVGVCIILYTAYLFFDLRKKYEPKFLYCKMITLLTFYINSIAVLMWVQIKIDSFNTVVSSVLVGLSLLMNFIDKSEIFNYYFFTDAKIKDISNENK